MGIKELGRPILLAAALVFLHAPPSAAQECSPTTADLKAFAAKTYAAGIHERNSFLVAMDDFVRGSIKNLDFHPVVIQQNPTITVAVVGPYSDYRMSLTEALRKMDPIDTIDPPAGFRVYVIPQTITAPDILKIVVERDDKIIEPLDTSNFVAAPMKTAMGLQKTIHAGYVLYPCAAFASGGTVRVTAIPDSGNNLVRTLGTPQLQNVR